MPARAVGIRWAIITIKPNKAVFSRNKAIANEALYIFFFVFFPSPLVSCSVSLLVSPVFQVNRGQWRSSW